MRIALCFLLAAGAFAGDLTQGALRRIDRQGRILDDCPLQHTSVKAEISGMLACVNVVQPARDSGRPASLLDQERPNVFT